MSAYELYDYDALLLRIGISDQQNWRCGDNLPEYWNYNEDDLSYDDVYVTPDASKGQPFGAAYDGRALKHPGSWCLSSDINVNGLLLNHRDENGTIWLCTDIEGWWTLPPSEIEDVPKPYWDGSMLTTGRYITRTITISGCFLPRDSSLVWYNRDLLLRAASIVRGVGLLAVCGNGSAPIDYTDAEYFDPYHDPSKMIMIQMNDVPLVDTLKPNGFTQFSLSFKCVFPAKLSVGERVQSIPFPTGGNFNYRVYESFSRPTSTGSSDVGGIGEPEGTGVTAYREVAATAAGNKTRKYSDVKLYNATNRIEDEDDEIYNSSTEDIKKLYLINKGNYFAFPVYVIEPFTFATTYIDSGGKTQTVQTKDKILSITNTATQETMQVVKEVPAGSRLVVDTGARRVALVSGADISTPSRWNWNARSYLTLPSAWVTLAPGGNQLMVSGPVKFSGNQPTAYWRDAWIG